MSATELIAERGKTHGSFESNAKYGQTLRLLFRNSPHWDRMSAVQCEALDMIACKLSRILSGQAGFKDHWADIAGYAQLVVNTPASYCERQIAHGYTHLENK